MKSNINLASRNENTREYQQVEIFDIEEINFHFDENMRIILYYFNVADMMSDLEYLDTDFINEIYRTQIMLIDSTMDFYFHEIVKLAVLNIYNGIWVFEVNKFYDKLNFTMSDLEKARRNPDDDEWLKLWVNNKFSTETMMSFSYFKDVCALVGADVSKIAKDNFYKRGDSQKVKDKLKEFLDRLYNRRNLITHQTDRRFCNAERVNVSREEVMYYIEHVIGIVYSLSRHIKQIEE